jgi:membrane-bound serine protease (ClpP class)
LIGSLDLVTTDTLAAPIYALAGGLVGFCLLAWVMVRFLPNSSAFRRFALYGESVGSDAYALAELSRSRELLGKKGVVLTTLRPAGTALFDDEALDVLSEGSYVPAGEPVEIVKVEGRKVVVRPSALIELGDGGEAPIANDDAEIDESANRPDEE